MYHISIINDFKQENTINIKNERGRYLCPITYDILTKDNTIKIENVLYSAKGLMEWTRQSIFDQYDDIIEVYEMNKYDTDIKTIILNQIQIRSPITNNNFEKSVIFMLYNLFIYKSDKHFIHAIYSFIMKKIIN